MPNLLKRLISKVAFVIAEYAHSKPALAQHMETSPFSQVLVLFAGSKIKSEMELAEKKRKQLEAFATFLNNEMAAKYVDLVPARVDSRASNTSEGLEGVRTEQSLTGTPATRMFVSLDSRRKRLDRLELELLRNKDHLNKLRHVHRAGQSEGILQSMQKALNYVVHFYHRRTTYALADWDNLPTTCHPLVHLIDFMGEYLALFTFDRELARYSCDIHGHPIDAQYYLGSGAQFLSPDAGNASFVNLDGVLKFLAVDYTLLTIITAADKSAPEIQAQIRLLIADRAPYKARVPLDQCHYDMLLNLLNGRETSVEINFAQACFSLSVKLSFLNREIATLHTQISFALANKNSAALERFDQVLTQPLTALLDADLFAGFKRPTQTPRIPRIDTQTHAEIASKIQTMLAEELALDATPLATPSEIRRESVNLFFNEVTTPPPSFTIRKTNSAPVIGTHEAGNSYSSPTVALL